MLTKSEIEVMTPDERIELAWLLWNSVYTDAVESSLSEEQKRELDRRLEYSLAHPGSGKPWREAMDEIELRLSNVSRPH